MFPEDTKRAIDFIIQSQARSDAKMERMHEEFEQQHQQTQVEIDGLIAEGKDLVQVSRRLLEVAQSHSRRLDRLESSET
jgi:hypothetical protein